MKSCPLCGGNEARTLKKEGRPSGLLQCRHCRSVYWETPWEARQAKVHYDGYYPTELPGYDPLTEKRYHAILNQMEQWRSPGRLLDVGCGAGHFLLVAEARGWQPMGSEVSKSALEIIHRVKNERRSKFSILESPLTEAGLPPASFDAVTLFEVVEHLENPTATLKEVHRILVRGGVLYLTTPNYNSLSRLLLNHRWRVIGEEHRCLMNPQALRGCLRALGFFPIQVTTKNIDVPEILSKWLPGKQGIHPTAKDSSSQRLRRSIERDRGLQILKGWINGLLRWSSLGDTMEAFLVKT